MKTLIRLTLMLTIAAIASLASIAQADVDLDRNAVWHSNYGDTSFYYLGTYRSLLYGPYQQYTGTITYQDGSAGNLTANYWVNYQQVTFTYTRQGDQGGGTLNLSYGQDENGNTVAHLDGRWKSTKTGASGPWNLWRLE
jgi:hypothetical protein